MNYLVPLFDCVLFSDEIFKLDANVKYKVFDENKNFGLIFSNNSSLPFVLDLKNPCENILNVECFNDKFYFLFPKFFGDFLATKFNYKSNEVSISLSTKLFITISGELICEKEVDNLTFSHYEIQGELCLIYFHGKRNFVVILKDKQLCFADFYEECNIQNDEKYFMCKLYDSLNHGKVCHVKENEVETYLVYLDDEDLCLKTNFVAHIFLDCVKAQNYKYANSLLSDEIKLQEEDEIKNFFPEFDFCYPLKDNVFVLANKKALSGIFEFDIIENQITNIKCL